MGNRSSEAMLSCGGKDAVKMRCLFSLRNDKDTVVRGDLYPSMVYCEISCRRLLVKVDGLDRPDLFPSCVSAWFFMRGLALVLGILSCALETNESNPSLSPSLALPSLYAVLTSSAAYQHHHLLHKIRQLQLDNEEYLGAA